MRCAFSTGAATERSVSISTIAGAESDCRGGRPDKVLLLSINNPWEIISLDKQPEYPDGPKIVVLRAIDDGQCLDAALMKRLLELHFVRLIRTANRALSSLR